MKRRKSINKYSRDQETMREYGKKQPATKGDMKAISDILSFSNLVMGAGYTAPMTKDKE